MTCSMCSYQTKCSTCSFRTRCWYLTCSYQTKCSFRTRCGAGENDRTAEPPRQPRGCKRRQRRATEERYRSAVLDAVVGEQEHGSPRRIAVIICRNGPVCLGTRVPWLPARLRQR